VKARRALVTGASGEIGRAIALRLGEAGHHVIVHANRSGERAAAICEQIRAHGGSADVVVFDVTDAEACAAALAPLVANEPVQILVNNAGIHDDAVLAGMSPRQWHAVIDVTLDGFYNVSQALLLPMIRSRWGRIVNISSIAALIGNRGQVNYSAAKAAVIGATKALALEVASRGITVNAVAPGIIATDMAASAFDEKTIKELVPMGRAGRPDEVAALVGFLASEDAAYLSGQVIALAGAIPTG
jgi:3-oxoacyl-[acyl-carrier protein] reductase